MPTITIKLDATARGRAPALGIAVQAYEPSADLAYVYTGAAMVGIRRICSTLQGRALSAGDLATQTGTDVQETDIVITSEDQLLAQSKATALGLPLAQVVGAGVATGLALLSGIDPGPFSTSGASRQFVRPFTV